MNLIGVKGTGFDDLLNFGNGDATGFGAGRVEILCGLAENQVAGLVGLPGFDNSQIGGQ